MKVSNHDTITAIATPIGVGAISVVRLSGPAAIPLAEKCFRGAAPLETCPGHTVHFGKFVGSDGRRIDEVLATVFRAPHSFTGEDAVEFSCHGGVYVTHRILETLLEGGARQSEPGEFTKRAFLNHRIDLSQAEAVADLIAAQTGMAHSVSLTQLEGKLGEKVGSLRTDLLALCGTLEVDLDFSEEGIEVIAREETAGRIDAIREELAAMADTFEAGRAFREGIPVVILGKPNAGKSSLFNALLRENRAIVTEIPGTTRDSLEESIVEGGTLLRLSDTAGLRSPGDPVEAEGVRRARALAMAAHILIYVLDATLGRIELPAIEDTGLPSPGQRLIIALNKVDLLSALPGGANNVTWNEMPVEIIPVSARTGEGLNMLRQSLVQAAGTTRGEGGVSVYLTSRRHLDAINRAKVCLGTALESLKAGVSNEFVAFDVREAVDSLSEVTGEVTSEEILNSIFSRFCVGK